MQQVRKHQKMLLKQDGTVQQDIPKQRSGTGYALDNATKILHIYGGSGPQGGEYDTMFHMHVPSGKCQQVICKNSVKMTDAKCFLYKQNLLAIGKEYVAKNRQFDTLYMFDVQNSIWKMLPCTGAVPPSTYYASTMLVEDKLYSVFGYVGIDSRSNYLNTMHVLDLQTLQWSEIAYANEAPLGRSSARAVLIGNDTYCYGGKKFVGRSNKDASLTDFWHFSLTSKMWTELVSPAALFPKDKSVLIGYGNSMYMYQYKRTNKLVLLDGHHGKGAIYDTISGLWSAFALPLNVPASNVATHDAQGNAILFRIHAKPKQEAFDHYYVVGFTEPMFASYKKLAYPDVTCIVNDK